MGICPVILSENQSTYISLRARRRLEKPRKDSAADHRDPIGCLSRRDNIVRLGDVYDRV